MAVGGPQQALNIPNPSELIGISAPAVTPSSVAQMSDALRQGFITADDIIARTGKRAQLKEKADVMALQRQMSPETLAAEDIVRKAAITKAQGSIDVAPGEVARAQAENKMATDIAEAGAGFSDVVKNLAGAGQQIPRTPEGKIDVNAAFSESANIDRWNSAQAAATANLPGKQIVEDANGKQSEVPWDKLTNRQLSPDEVSERYAVLGKTSNYSVWKSSDLFGPKPGQVTTLPAPAVSPAVTPSKSVIMPADQIGVGSSVIKESPAPKPAKAPADVQVELASLQEDLNSITNAKNIVATKDVVGPQTGNIAMKWGNKIAAAFGARLEETQNQNELEIAISKKVLEGAQKMKGNLSDRDIRFLQASYPSLASAPKVWNDFLNSWERMIHKNQEVLQGLAPKGSSVLTPEQSRSVLEPNAPTPPLSTAPNNQTIPEYSSEDEGVKSGAAAFRVKGRAGIYRKP